MNQILRSTGTRIIGSFAGNAVVFLLVSPPGGQKELLKQVKALEESGAFESVSLEIAEEEL